MTPDELGELLGGRRVGGIWMAPCPAHDDSDPSLSITAGRSGVLVHCHAGCTQEAVLAALPVDVRELFNSPSSNNGRREVAAYDYADERGVLQYQMVRFEPGDNGKPKTFRPRHPDPTAPGGFIYGMNGTRGIPYRLAELVRAVKDGKRVFVCEGEKDADAVCRAGFTATTNPFGAGKWRADYNQHFQGADVVIVTDRDAPGYEHARDVERHLKSVAAKVVVVEPATGKDISDHFAAGRKLGELVPMATPRAAEPESGTDVDGFIRVGILIAEPDNPHPWVVYGLVPSGGMALAAGKPKAGKSTLARAIGLRVCRGEPVLGRDTMAGPVLYLGLEDPREAIKGHFRRMGATATDDLHVYTGKVPEQAQLWLAEQLAKRDPVLVVIDTMQFFLGIAEINEYGQVVNALRSILELFRGKRAAVLIVHHAGKGDRIGFDAILGSTGILGTVDTAILIKRRPDDQSRTIATMQRMHAPGGQDMPETVLTLDDHTEPKLAGTRAEYDLDKMGDAIVDYLTRQADWQERGDVLAGVEGATKMKVDALDRLFRSSRVERQGEGKRGKPYLFRVLRTESPQPEKPFFRSTTTVRTAERNPDNATSESAASSNSVLPFSGLDEIGPVPRTESGRLCPKGHTKTHLPDEPLDRGWVCTTCYPAVLA